MYYGAMFRQTNEVISMTQQEFQQRAHTIPHQPGIYKYYDANDVLLYVGKAKDLRKRVSSYFSKTFTTYKTHELVQRISKIEFTIVDSEQDAFLLENALIKEYQPRFNINLKDDKTYPYIVIKKEPFPHFSYPEKINDGSEYLGPFTSAGKVRSWLLLSDKIFHCVPANSTCLTIIFSEASLKFVWNTISVIVKVPVRVYRMPPPMQRVYNRYVIF